MAVNKPLIREDSLSLRSTIRREVLLEMKVDRVRANHSLRLTASQGTSNIPFHWFLLLGSYRQAQTLTLFNECLAERRGPRVEKKPMKKKGMLMVPWKMFLKEKVMPAAITFLSLLRRPTFLFKKTFSKRLIR